MKLSLDWISEFVDLNGIDPGELAEKVTVHTAEVDGVAKISRTVRNVVVAKVLSTREIVGVATTKAARIDAGGEVLDVVCAAPNVRDGMLTLVALPGAVLTSGDTVEATEVHGVRSVAMLCSAHELGFGYGSDGIVELPSDGKPGQSLAELIAASDTILEIDNKSITHRPDLWSHYGFAREIGAIFGRSLRPLETADVQQFSGLPALGVRIDSPDCPFYSAIRFGVGGPRPSPVFMQGRLGAIGSRPRNLLVDITNYVQFEIGQPTHAFDAAKVSNIVVANAKVPLDLTTLDGTVRKIAPGDLLIQDNDTPIALAGIMGGASTEITDNTRDVLLESASFRGPRIRVTSMRLGVRSDASQRFEKKLPSIFAPLATGRILRLLERAGVPPAVKSSFSFAGAVDETRRIIDIPAGYITRRAGAPIDEANCKRILDSIGFESTIAHQGGLHVSVPPFRSTFDISTREDISEEILRLYGYDAIRPSLPAAAIDSAPINPVVRNHHRARRILAQSYSFVELKTYSWYSAQWLQTIGYAPARRTLDLRNPIGADRASLRESLVPNLLAAVEPNRSEASKFRIFEIGKIFWLDEEGKKHEANQLCGLIVDQDRAASPEMIFASARSAVEDIARAAGAGSLRTQPGENSIAPWRRTSATMNILLGQKVIGSMGMLPSALCAKILGPGHIAWFTIDIDCLSGETYPATPYNAPPVFPGSTQDFTFVPKPGTNYAEIEAILETLQAEVRYNRSFVSTYAARYTFRYHIFNPDRTLTSDDINAFRATLVRHIEANGVHLLDSDG